MTLARLVGLVAFGAIALAATAAQTSVALAKPNIVFILADDLGMDGVGCYGSDVHKNQTTNIDALAAGGTRFESCYSAPMCGPSRCELMTGRYAFRTGGLTNKSWEHRGDGAKAKDEYPIARLLKENGYATCQAGKWRQVGETPRDWGFDQSLTDPEGSGWYWKNSYIKNGQTITTDKVVYVPDLVQQFALDFIDQNKDRPFFLYLAPHLVHTEVLPTPDTKPGTSGLDALYADDLMYLDKQVGQIVKELERQGLREKTLIVFAGDNGTAPGRPTTVNGRVLSGHKGSMREGGSRVPLICNWPGVTPAGKVLKDLTDFSDLHATFAEVAGAAEPKSLTIDGNSFAPQLHGQAGHPREWAFVQLGKEWYVRSPGWKLNQAGELFDMKGAPFSEKAVPADTTDAAARAAREQLSGVLKTLNPAAGNHERGGGDDADE